MRKGWEYKKLGEVAKISSGKAIPSSDIIDTFSEGLYPCYGGNGLRGYVDHFSNDGLVPVIGRVGALCGNVHLPQGKFYATEHALVVYLKTKDKPHYIEYLLSSLNLRQYAKGVAQPVLSASTLSDILIPVPPLSEQERIVSELDILSSIIEKKKAQLKEYDQLAQSFFYDMFGDPVSNEKGWEVKKLGEVCETTSGGTPSKKHPEYYEGGTTPWLRSGEVCQGFIYHTELFITEEGLKCSSAKMVPVNSVAIAMYGATCGQVGIIKSPMCTNQAVCCIFPNNTFIPIFLYFFLLSKKSEYLKVAVGGAQPNISQSVIKQTLISIPPLSLQQSFVSKIEAIEKQKELIKQSITETETLFNSRMDYYFN